MSDEEVDELLKIADTSSGEVNYTGPSYPPSPPAPYLTFPYSPLPAHNHPSPFITTTGRICYC